MQQGNLFAQEPIFSIHIDGRDLPVEERWIDGSAVYFVRGLGAIPFCITQAERPNGSKFWTGVGNADKDLAALLGRCIEKTKNT